MSILQSHCTYTLPTIKNKNRYYAMDKDTLIEHVCNQAKRIKELNITLLNLEVKKLDVKLLDINKELEKKIDTNELSRKSQKISLIIMLDRMLRGY
jgi:hypothetical protein